MSSRSNPNPECRFSMSPDDESQCPEYTALLAALVLQKEFRHHRSIITVGYYKKVNKQANKILMFKKKWFG